MKECPSGVLGRPVSHVSRAIVLWPALGVYRRAGCAALDLQEFQKIYSQFFPSGDSDAFAAYVFNVFDHNKVRTHHHARSARWP